MLFTLELILQDEMVCYSLVLQGEAVNLIFIKSCVALLLLTQLSVTLTPVLILQDEMVCYSSVARKGSHLSSLHLVLRCVALNSISLTSVDFAR